MIRIVERMSLREKKARHFTDRKTGVRWYDDMLEKPKYYRNIKNIDFTIEWMTPEEYYRRCADGFRKPVDALVKERTNKSTDSYEDKMRRGTKFDMLVLDYSEKRFSQEGLHRALASYRVDPNLKVPVMVVTKWKPDREFRKPLIYDEHGNVMKYSS